MDSGRLRAAGGGRCHRDCHSEQSCIIGHESSLAGTGGGVAAG